MVESSTSMEIRGVESTQSLPSLTIQTTLPSGQVKSSSAIAYPTSPVDRYGFLVSDKRYSPQARQVKSPSETPKDSVWLENRRTQKWMSMTGGISIEDWERTKQKQPAKLKSRVRKGIPDAIRGIAWPHLAGSSLMMKNNPGMYRDLVATTQVPCEDTILRDIGRTFPKHHLFKDSTSIGQSALLNVLKAYSVYDPNVGYCQGMGFISALFLSYMPEEQTFWHLVACLNHKKYGMADIYRPGMRRVVEIMAIFDQCLKIYVPKLAEHLDAEGLHPTMYATQWFVTIFAYSFPFDFVTRVWDIFLHEGWKIVFRVAVALLKVNERKLATLKFEKIMEFFRDMPPSVDTDEVVATAVNIPMTNRQLQALRENYQPSQMAQ
ncbi:Rab GTPase-activating protein 1 [Aphanomyces cochlioides]|nr:Rab GTPase-activating protein 1 [Aphanomyces cochlioides]